MINIGEWTASLLAASPPLQDDRQPGTLARSLAARHTGTLAHWQPGTMAVVLAKTCNEKSLNRKLYIAVQIPEKELVKDCFEKGHNK